MTAAVWAQCIRIRIIRSNASNATAAVFDGRMRLRLMLRIGVDLPEPKDEQSDVLIAPYEYKHRGNVLWLFERFKMLSILALPNVQGSER